MSAKKLADDNLMTKEFLVQNKLGIHARPAADFVVFGPVFEKQGAKKVAGLDEFRKVCGHRIPVLALGGVTTENAHLCLEAGASGTAGIRLFQENNVAEVVKKLRGLK